jgi:hypothetical protein
MYADVTSKRCFMCDRSAAAYDVLGRFTYLRPTQAF